ncbi:acyl-CoA dehydrogenase, C-terminal domain protein [Pseudomonas fluorescens Q2-87]|uniref:Acyl-CoA dehydrogenase, C-terminal domain protein n=1 Tax=Pseudomonas fluorescens (strain Q2-87) TaxID=1038922 RepID=J2EZ41_PSEFQ|nr:acyl-CoA dehydrogenase C-terminal domain protein [Pseudomonas fluorescens]EJL01923.1 acyl-CoA dehydrogenase, C-terminal domain protein [Pseudomonas fluorescens Q2-87]
MLENDRHSLDGAIRPTPVERVRQRLAGWQQRAADAEQNRTLSQATFDELFDDGLLELVSPRREPLDTPGWPVLMEASRLAARACASTAWMISLVGGHAAIAGRLSRACQHRLFANGRPQLFASASVGPHSRLLPDADGTRVNGTWRFSSGIEQATWLLLNAPVTDHDGTPGSERMLVVVSTRDVEILDTWDTCGMAATGSHDVLLRNVLVPAEQVFRLEDIFAHRTSELPGDYLYSVPIVPFITTSLLGPVLGCAEGAYASYIESLRQQKIPAPARERLAHSAAQLSAATALYTTLVSMLHESGQTRRSLSMDELLRLKRDRSYVARLCLQAIQRLVEHAGASSMTRDNTLHHQWRDLQAMVAHRDVHWDSAMLGYADFVLDAPACPHALITP